MPLFRRRFITNISIFATILTCFASPFPNPTATAQLSEDLGEIVFASNRDGDFDIYVMNSEGGEVRQLTDDDASDTYPRWSPDSSQIVYIADANELYIINADGTGNKRITDNDASDYYPQWRPIPD